MSIIFKKTIQAARAKKLSCALLAVCMAIVILLSTGSIIFASAASDGKMLEVYNANSWNDQFVGNYYNSLPAGTYVLTANFKNEGRWLMQAQIDDNGAANPSNPWRQVPGNIKTESETEYLTTIKFTTTDTHNFRVRFVAPNFSDSKLWIANVTLCREGETENLLTNGDFTDGINGWTITNQDTTFANATTKDIEEGFFDKPTQTEPSGKMLEVYNESGESGKSFKREASASLMKWKLSPGTYKFSAYFKHEGGWNMEFQIYENNAWKTVSTSATEAENAYFTSGTFTVNGDRQCRVLFTAPATTSKLWVADVSIRHITGGDYLGNSWNFIGNGDFSSSDYDGTLNWNGLMNGSQYMDAAFNNKTVKDIPDGFFDKTVSPSGKMLEVYNQTAKKDQYIEQQIKSLPAGTYVLSAYYKNEGDWLIQAQTWDNPNPASPTNLWRQVPGRITTESEDQYLTTIKFTINSPLDFRARFVSYNGTASKLWIANVTLCREGETENLLTNGDFTDGTNGWSFSDQPTFANATTKDIEKGFFNKPTGIAPPSGKMVEVYNESGTAGKLVEKQTATNLTLTPGTYKLSAYFKHEGGWTMQAALYYNNRWNVAGDAITESEDFHHTTITFTVPSNVSSARFSVRFIAPETTSKLWIADVSAYHITGGDWLGNCTNYVANGDFTDSRNDGMANWGGLVNDAAFTGNAIVKDVEDGFFDRDPQDIPIVPPSTGIDLPSGKMLEAYNKTGFSNQQLEKQLASLPAGTYVLTAYYKNEGDWIMQAQTDDNPDTSVRWRQVPDRITTESEDKYLTTIKFTTTASHGFRVRFIAPQSENKLWIANVTLCREGETTNLLANSAGATNWSFTNQATTFPDAAVKDIPNGFFDVREKKMAVLYNQNPTWGGQLSEAIIGKIPAGDYVFSANFKHDGSWSATMVYHDGSKWTAIPGAQTVKSTDEYKTTISFTLSSAQEVRLRFNAPMNKSVAYIANAKMYKVGEQSDNYIVNGDFANGFTNWSYSNTASFANKYLEAIPADFFNRGALTPQMVHVINTGGSGSGAIYQWLYLEKDKEYTLSYDINYIGEIDEVVGAAAYVNVQYPTSSGTQYYLPYYAEVSSDRYTKKYTIRVHDLAVTSNGEARMKIGLQFLPREAYVANIVLTEKGKTENLLANSDFKYGFEGWEQGASCVELVPYDNSKFVRTATKPLTGKYMLYSDGSKSYADFGQHLKLPRLKGNTEIQYEFKCRYRATDGKPGLRMAFHPVGAARYADAAKTQGAFNMVSEYDDETGYWYGIFTIPEKSYIDKDGLAHIFLSVNTELSGAGYFSDFELYDITNDEGRTKNLLVNPDFKQGLWGWVGTDMWTVPELNFNTLKFTECRQLFSLVPYDEKMFIKNDSEQYFNDGEWWIKYGEQRVEEKEDNSVITQVVKGKMDFSDGTPISDAPLVLRSDLVFETFTEMDGSFEFNDIPVGKYSLYMKMEDGSEMFIIEFNVKQGDVVTVSAAYNLETGSFDGTLTTVPNTGEDTAPDTDKDTDKVTGPGTNDTEKGMNTFVLLLIIFGSIVIIAVIVFVTIWLLKKYRANHA